MFVGFSNLRNLVRDGFRHELWAGKCYLWKRVNYLCDFISRVKMQHEQPWTAVPSWFGLKREQKWRFSRPRVLTCPPPVMSAALPTTAEFPTSAIGNMTENIRQQKVSVSVAEKGCRLENRQFSDFCSLLLSGDWRFSRRSFPFQKVFRYWNPNQDRRETG